MTKRFDGILTAGDRKYFERIGLAAHLAGSAAADEGTPPGFYQDCVTVGYDGERLIVCLSKIPADGDRDADSRDLGAVYEAAAAAGIAQVAAMSYGDPEGRYMVTAMLFARADGGPVDDQTELDFTNAARVATGAPVVIERPGRLDAPLDIERPEWLSE